MTLRKRTTKFLQQLPDANISRVYAALEAMGEAEALKLLDNRIVY